MPVGTGEFWVRHLPDHQDASATSDRPAGSYRNRQLETHEGAERVGTAAPAGSLATCYSRAPTRSTSPPSEFNNEAALPITHLRLS
jgi:hypothetical protein